ncbi:hypothetical protein BS17DRAFT_788409 [Gyrodon lividus]|nr:hypothetical protein BS17DRAFT_788409 [Gyrodon lividus]
MPSPLFGVHAYNGHQALIHDIMSRHTVFLGIDTRMPGEEAIDHCGNDDTLEAGVLLRPGEKLEVGFGRWCRWHQEPTRKNLLGYQDRPRPSVRD